MKLPYTCDNLPIKFNFSTDIALRLAEAMERYGIYKGLLELMEFDREHLLLSFIKMDSYKSTQIEGTQVSQSDLFSIEYLEQTDDVIELQNYSKAFELGRDLISKGKLELEDINKLHRVLLDSVRGGTKEPGVIRKEQNWIGSVKGIENADFIPPKAEELPILMNNFTEYFNNADYSITSLIQVAITHAQFETIHPYRDGNGRIGRLLIPLQMALISNDYPILYISEVIEQYKRAYVQALMDFRKGKPENFIIFFLQCVVDQCNAYIYRIKRINEIIKINTARIHSEITSKKALILHEILIKKIAVKVTELVEITGLNINTVRTLLKSLMELGIVEKRQGTTEYIYKDIYNIFMKSE